MPGKRHIRRANPSAATCAVLAGAWVVLYVLFGLTVPGGKFWQPENLETIARQTAIVGFASIGMTFVIIRGAIDLSVGSVVAFVTVVTAHLIQVEHLDGVTAGLLGVLAGCLCGLVNGLIVTGFRVSPFIATLGSLLLIRGIAKGIANEQKVDVDHCPEWLKSILARLDISLKWMVFAPGVWMLLLAAVVAAIVLRRTVFGRNVIAAGANEEAAFLCGLPVRRELVMVFVVCGVFTGLAGLLQFSRLTVGDPTVAAGLELDVIAAVVIGGASLSGGQGSIAGSLLGALVMTTIKSGSTQLGLTNWIQEITTGLIIVSAVSIDRLRNRKVSE
jgi:ribose transport system permease protein